MSASRKSLIAARLQTPGARKLLVLSGVAGFAMLWAAPDVFPALQPYRIHALSAAIIWLMGFGFLTLLSITYRWVLLASSAMADRHSKETEIVKAEISRLQGEIQKLDSAQTDLSRSLDARINSMDAVLKEAGQTTGEHSQALARLDEAAQILRDRLEAETTEMAQTVSVGRVADVEHIAITGALLAGAAMPEGETGNVPRRQHGHALLMRQLFHDSAKNRIPKAANGYHLLEIGTTREKWWPQMSTSRLAATCRALSLRMLTVDVDPKGMEAVRELSSQYPKVVSGATDFGEKYLESWEGELPPYIYIDAYDFDHPEHSEERQDRYRSLQGSEISDEACWEMHLACAREIAKKCPAGGIVAFDDAFYDGSSWSGKGKTAVPYLLANGFTLLIRSDSAALFVKEGLEQHLPADE